MRIPNLLMHVFIMPNPFVICSCIYEFCLGIAIRYSMRIPGVIAIKMHTDMHEQTTKGFGKMNTCISNFGIHIGRKYLNEYTPFGSVSLCI